MSANTCEQLGERLAVQDARVAMFTATGDRDWAAVAAAFAGRVRLDYASLSGGGPAVLSGRQIAGAWPAAPGGLDATRHLTGNYLIAADGYHWNGTVIDRSDVVAQLRDKLPALQRFVHVPYAFSKKLEVPIKKLLGVIPLEKRPASRPSMIPARCDRTSGSGRTGFTRPA